MRSRCAHRLWQSVSPSFPPVLRPKVGNPKGAEPPWSSGKESRGNRLEIGSLWRVFAYFLHVEKVGRRRRRDDGAKSRRKRRIRRRLEVSPLRRGREQDEGYFAPAGATFFRSAAKEGKDAPEGTYFEAVPSGLPPRRPRGLRPHWIPHFWTGDEGRGTKDGGRRTRDEGRGFAMTGLGGGCVCPGFPVLAAFSAPFLAMTRKTGMRAGGPASRKS